MHDARDAEDRRLLEAGDFAQLLANYFHPVRQRLVARLRDDDAANEVAQTVFDRLLRELAAGKAYPVPFRVVVWRVTEWKLNEHFGRRRELPVPDMPPAGAADELAELEARADLASLFAELPERQREVATLRYLEGLEPAQIAARLGIEANAVYQALFNANGRLRELLPLA
jgi:RNA polymerase sigma factor (sigma-70 family)